MTRHQTASQTPFNPTADNPETNVQQAIENIRVTALASSFSAVSKDDISKGQPVYVDPVTGKLSLADASSLPKSNVIGLCSNNVNANYVASVEQTLLKQSDWTLVTGTSLLVKGRVYYLDSNLGKLTHVAPTAAGYSVVRIGIAVTEDALSLSIQEPIYL